MIHILIPFFNRKELTLECLSTLSNQTCKDYSITLVDDGSNDGSVGAIKNLYPQIEILQGPGNWWWAKSLNEGLKIILPQTKLSDFILILNNDTEVKSDYLEKIKESSERNGRAVVGSLLKNFYTNEIIPKSIKVEWSTFSFPQVIPNLDLKDTKNVDMLTTRGILIPSEVFKKIGTFTCLLPHHGADINFSMKAKRDGFLLVLSHEAIVYSKEQPGEKNWSFWYKFFGRRSSSNTGMNLMLTILNAPTVYLKIKCIAVILWRFLKELGTYLFKN